MSKRLPDGLHERWACNGVNYAIFPCPRNISFLQAWKHWSDGVTMLRQPPVHKADQWGGGWCVGIITPRGKLVRVLPVNRAAEWIESFVPEDERYFSIWGDGTD